MNARNEREANAEMGRCPPCNGDCWQGRRCTARVQDLRREWAAKMPPDPAPDSMVDWDEAPPSSLPRKWRAALDRFNAFLLAVVLAFAAFILGAALDRWFSP